jgi:hypothetical protein
MHVASQPSHNLAFISRLDAARHCCGSAVNNPDGLAARKMCDVFDITSRGSRWSSAWCDGAEFVRHEHRCSAHETQALAKVEGWGLEIATVEDLHAWMGNVPIGRGEDGPTAFWRSNTEGLLLTAGPRVANMVAGAGFEPATFGL